MDSEVTIELDVDEVVESATKESREKTVMVSARIPASLRNKVNDILKRQGITQTELILAAYNYVFATGYLPEDSNQPVRGRHRYNPTPEEIEAFKRHMRSIQGQIRPEADEWDYDRLKFEAMKERYPEYLGGIEYEESR